jgi:DNA-binding protein Fis
MKPSVYNFFKEDIQKMAASLTRYEDGNIHYLIISEVEKSLINIVLEQTKNNYCWASKILGISRSTLYRKAKLLGIYDSKN